MAQETGEALVPLVKLSHSSWADDVRLARYNEQLTYGGEVYLPYNFNISLPDEEAEGVPVLQFRGDNVDQLLVEELRGITEAVDAEVVIVLASNPSYAEVGPVQMQLYAIDYDAFSVSGTMTIEPVLEKPFGYRKMTPANAPGLF